MFVFDLTPTRFGVNIQDIRPKLQRRTIHSRSLKTGETPVSYADLNWVCEHLVVELCAPAASWDSTSPGLIEQLLLRRVRNEIGVGIYPNENQTDTSVAASLVDSARAARLGTLTVTAPEILRRAQLRTDFGAVKRANPVDKNLEVQRPEIVTNLVQTDD